jgi:hypothetical protein
MCTVLSVITWLPFAGGPMAFWWVWLGRCGPILLFTPLALLGKRSRGSGSDGLPAEYLRHEYHDDRRAGRPDPMTYWPR